MKRREALKMSVGFMGFSLSGIVFSSMLNGCKVDTKEDWIPIFLTKEQGTAVAEMAEHILPKTTSVGAKDVLVHRFIDKLVAECYDTDGQIQFTAGLEEFQAFCQEKIGKHFEDCTVEERNTILADQEETPYEPARYLWGNKVKDEGNVTFYRQFKGLTLFGYFSSEEVGENILNYDPIPGKFVGCIPLEEVGSAWSL
ncbi:gluconate 2-dehydrogenase subunit 3 family protein [Zobellia nedashkovskayae]|uniref:gluconate 2-dehydrogenase subunit 3 family protein n=1 Tax=Zobellia nedashkovskayae TaxID=2779510 RepID=UPI00188C0E7B|nr:gluconate 2-dehydrogenase subunit 3 family protein [Zobellia nedashkovskayae]